MERILVVEDDRAVQKALKRLFEAEGFAVEIRSDGKSALEAYRAATPSAVVLDLRLPAVSGRDVCREIKQEAPALPVIILSAASDVSDKVLLLELGADDYVTKPFSPRELLARVGAVLRRVRPALAGEQLAYADIEMDLEAHRVRRSGKPVQLGPTEFRLLRHFMERPGRVFSRERLLDSVWAHDPEIDARTVDVHIRRLRKSLNEGGLPDVIRTVRSAGYSLDAEG